MPYVQSHRHTGYRDTVRNTGYTWNLTGYILTGYTDTGIIMWKRRPRRAPSPNTLQSHVRTYNTKDLSLGIGEELSPFGLHWLNKPCFPYWSHAFCTRPCGPLISHDLQSGSHIGKTRPTCTHLRPPLDILCVCPPPLCVFSGRHPAGKQRSAVNAVSFHRGSFRKVPHLVLLLPVFNLSLSH